MGSIQGGAVVLLLLAITSAALAIECYHCVDLKFPNSPQIRNLHVNGYCSPDGFKGNAKSVTSQRCANDTDVCQHVMGKYEFDHPDAGIVMADVNLRRCLKYNEKLANAVDGCLPNDQVDADAHKLDIFPGDAMGDMLKFNGQVCTCNKDQCNGATNLGISLMFVSLLVFVGSILVN